MLLVNEAKCVGCGQCVSVPNAGNRQKVGMVLSDGVDPAAVVARQWSGYNKEN